VKRKDPVEGIESLVCDLKAKRSVSAEGGEGSKFVSETEMQSVVSLREEWKEWERKMEKQRQILRIPDKLFAPRVQHFSFDSSTPLNGIIHYLTTVCGDAQKMIEKKVLLVSASSEHSDPYKAMRAVDQKSDTFFLSKNQPGDWLCLDFNEMRVIPTLYTIQTRHDCDSGDYHPKSWVLEYSETGQADSWITLDVQNEADMNRKSARKTIEISNAPECRFLRIRMTNLNYHGDNYLCVGQFEVFGTLLSTEKFPGSPGL
jgi:hypothetical protein